MGQNTILIFDSGLGGLTVYDEIVNASLAASFIYIADNAGFPYGALTQDVLIARVLSVLDQAIERFQPELVVIACNTASTLVLPHLRVRYHIPFVGTVPAIKPAVAASRTKRITVLATPGTVARDYTRTLVQDHAAQCHVTLVGSQRLAQLAEDILCGQTVDDESIRAEILPCFVEENGQRTDTIVLACTHYPLLLNRFMEQAPWPVAWIDPAPAIARRVVQLMAEPRASCAAEDAPLRASKNTAVFTREMVLNPFLVKALQARGLEDIVFHSIPFDEKGGS